MSRPTYEEWCKEFRFGSMCKIPDKRRPSQPGEFDHDKFIKRIQNYGKDEKQQNFWRQVCETFFTLCKGKVQKAWNKIDIA
jgi:hypothetical protein